jgi:acylphosphatase
MSLELAIARRLRIRGVVQGVGFRWHMQQRAQALGLAGWVRNRGDGSVEALVCGAPEAVAALLCWAGRGPEAAAVEHLLVEDSDERHVQFVQRPTEF